MNVLVEFAVINPYTDPYIGRCSKLWRPAKLTGRWRLEEKIENGEHHTYLWVEIVRKKYRFLRSPIEIQQWVREDNIRYWVQHIVNNCEQK